MGGGGWPRPRLRAPSSCRPPGPRSCQLARYPRTTPAISTASLPVLARRFRADPHEVGRIEGLGLDSLELAEHVDQGQQIEVSAGHEPEDVAPVSSSPRTSDPQPVTPDGTISNRVSSSTRASVGRDTAPGISLLMEWWTIHHRGALQSLARDARRSHRSVEGDEKPHKMRERERQTATKPRYYIRGIEITAQTGLGRFGGAGGASPSTSATRIMPFTWASVVPAGTVPKDYPRHFDGLSARPVAPVSRRSPRNRAHRGHRA